MAEDPLPFLARRSPVYGTRGMVATSQPLAAQVGLSILEHGGNAADAAVATAAALNVTEPTSTGIGGDCFAMFFDSATRRISALNGSGRAPAGLSLDLLRRQGFAGELPPFHAHTVTVPGACAGWEDMVARHGKLPLREVLGPAIRLAEEGFPVAPITSYFWALGVERQLAHALGGEELTLKGRAPRAGEIFRNPGLARTFQAVAEGGSHAFYQGQIGRSIVAAVKTAGGVLDESDLASHQSTWDEPISSTYRGIRVWECPPNGQGLTALLALNLLEGFELASTEALGAERLHLILESLRIAFADSSWYIADPSSNPIPLQELLSKAYASERRRLISRTSASTEITRGLVGAGSDTVYLSAIDGEGNACSLINSNYMGFGTGIVPRGWGFSLQNRGHGFSLDSTHPNALAPGKRPYHTIIPGLATRRDKSLFACFGVMGGFMQPQGHVQVLTAIIDDGLDPQAALDRPRVSLIKGAPDSPVAVEEGIPVGSIAELERLGHAVQRITGQARATLGRGQIIVRNHQTGVLCGGSDPRGDGCAVALA